MCASVWYKNNNPSYSKGTRAWQEPLFASFPGVTVRKSIPRLPEIVELEEG